MGFGTNQKALEVNVSGFVVTLDLPVPSLKYQTLSDNYDARKYGRRTNYSNIEKQAFLLKWKDILWFKKQIKSKPMVIKGIMHPDDAAKAFKYKADAIWVSNHGGRVFNSIISPFEVLPSIRKKVGKSKIIIIDGGIRSGADIVKACHLGANIVSIGRPAIYGLIASGSIGVKKLFDILKKDYFISKKLSGY